MLRTSGTPWKPPWSRFVPNVVVEDETRPSRDLRMKRGSPETLGVVAPDTSKTPEHHLCGGTATVEALRSKQVASLHHDEHTTAP